MTKQNLLSGLRATSQPHIGNYLGAIRQFISLQNEYNCFFMIANLHTLTTPFDPKDLRKNTIEVAADYIALGLDPHKCALFVQSDVPEHSEMTWVFDCITPLGELYRMTQFKEKSGDEKKEQINAGLLNYPVLMAVDILLYKSAVVPVGEDQVQHVELARTLARKFNNRFGKTFNEPKPLLSKSMRVKSLVNPDKKMSKTGDEALLLTDTPEEIRRKLKKAVTASDARGKSAGVENLMLLLREFSSKEKIKYFENALADNSIKFSELKETLAEDISEHFAPFRQRRQELLADPQKIASTLADGAIAARKAAKTTYDEVKEKIGLL